MPFVSGGAGGGGGSVLFATTLAADTATIDSGAAGFNTTLNVLSIYILGRTDDAGAISNPTVILNNDSGAHYDIEVCNTANASVSGANSLAAAAWTLTAHGSGGLASQPSATIITFPGYGGTTFFKAGSMYECIPDSTAANCTIRTSAIAWRQTAAINRVATTAAGGQKWKAGTIMIVSAI